MSGQRNHYYIVGGGEIWCEDEDSELVWGGCELSSGWVLDLDFRWALWAATDIWELPEFR